MDERERKNLQRYDIEFSAQLRADTGSYKVMAENEKNAIFIAENQFLKNIKDISNQFNLEITVNYLEPVALNLDECRKAFKRKH